MKQLTDEFRLILRGIRYIHRLAPGNLLVKLIKNTLMAALPFLDLYFSARILDVLIAKESITKAIILALLLAVSHFAVQLGSAVMDIKNYEMFNGLYRRYNMMISAKVMGLDYEKVEDPETHKAVRHIDNAMKISNFGLIKVHSRIPLLVASNCEAGGNGGVGGGTGVACGAATAASRDPQVAYKAAKVGGTEAMAIGSNWNFAPIVDLQIAGAGHRD